MARIVLACGTFITGAAACADSNAPPRRYFNGVGAPLVAPVNQNDTPNTTASKQTGDLRRADAPLVGPDRERR